MIIQRKQHTDRPNEVAVYFTNDQFDKINAALAMDGQPSLNESDEREQRRYCKNVLNLIQGAERPKRFIINLDEGTKLDSKELGNELVERFAPQEDPDKFDPDYSPIDFTLRVFDPEGERTILDFTENPNTYDTERLERTLQTAELIVAFSLTPPNLA